MLEVAGCGDAIQFHHDGFEFNDGNCPAHDRDIVGRLHRYPPSAKIIYLDRDPRDVMVSLYHQITGRFADFYAYHGDLSGFIRDPYFGAAVLAEFRATWATIITERLFLTVHYEDLHRDARAELCRVVAYLGVAVPAERLDAAIAAGRFEAMRELEQSGAHDQPWLRLRNGCAKVRRGEVGAFITELDPGDIAYLDETFGFTPGP